MYKIKIESRSIKNITVWGLHKADHISAFPKIMAALTAGHWLATESLSCCSTATTQLYIFGGGGTEPLFSMMARTALSSISFPWQGDSKPNSFEWKSEKQQTPPKQCQGTWKRTLHEKHEQQNWCGEWAESFSFFADMNTENRTSVESPGVCPASSGTEEKNCET